MPPPDPPEEEPGQGIADCFHAIEEELEADPPSEPEPQEPSV